MGLGRVFRPLVRAPEGYGIGEVDLSQIEVGIAAAVFRDPRLIEDFNAGDVYVAMAKRIFHAELTPDDLVLDNPTFKSRHCAVSQPYETARSGDHLWRDDPWHCP